MLHGGDEMQDRFSYDNMIDRSELKRLQDGMCRATGVCACCVDAKGEELADWSGRQNNFMY